MGGRGIALLAVASVLFACANGGPAAFDDGSGGSVDDASTGSPGGQPWSLAVHGH
jgi:hypothetical protein